jgi:hypothetical protein
MAEKPEAPRIQHNVLLMLHISWPPDEICLKKSNDFTEILPAHMLGT